MTLEFILRCAVSSMIRGHHKPHCFSAWVNGQGYVSSGLGPIEDRADYLRQLERTATSEVENLSFASAYAEPGYTDPPKGIAFANWNSLPRGLNDILERAGYAVEWSDEWTTCEDCGKAIRTSPDSYSYQPYSVLVDDCSIVCLACIDWTDYLESIEDNPDRAVVRNCNPADYGYRLLSGSAEYENGFHPGQNDRPADILKALHAKGHKRIVFRIPETSQFYITFETWQKIEDEDDSE